MSISVIGLDLSLCATGVVVVADGKMQSSQLVTSKPAKGALAELNRLRGIRSKIKDIIESNPDIKLAVIEGLAFGIKDTTSLAQLSGLNYLIREMLSDKGIPFIIVAPTSLKKFVTGKGNCQKDMVLLYVFKNFGESLDNNNIADALGLAKMGYAVMVNTELYAYQKDIIKSLKETYEKETSSNKTDQ